MGNDFCLALINNCVDHTYRVELFQSGRSRISSPNLRTPGQRERPLFLTDRVVARQYKDNGWLEG